MSNTVSRFPIVNICSPLLVTVDTKLLEGILFSRTRLTSKIKSSKSKSNEKLLNLYYIQNGVAVLFARHGYLLTLLFIKIIMTSYL